MKNITLQDIANHLKVSKATASFVLNGHGDEKRVSKATQEKILNFAKKHNYKANHLARGLSLGKSDTIGLIVPNIADSYFARIARRVERKARRSGYNLVFSSTRENRERESELIQNMLNRGVDGLIIASSQKNQADISSLKKNKFPFVLIDRYYKDLETNYVGEDNEGGASYATEQLLKTGRKRIAFITLNNDLVALHQRIAGYRRSMKQHGLPIDDEWIGVLDYEYVEADMLEQMHSLSSAPSNIEGIVFATHFLAASGIRALRELNMRIPTDVALVSFGEMDAFDLVDPPVTSVVQPVDELGDSAMEILLENLGGKITNNRRVILKNRLEIRKSCGVK